APFLVNMPMTSADGKGWISDIHVFPKNQTVSPTKTPLNGSSVSVGDVKTWKVAFNVPENMVESAQLIVSDTLDGALTYKTDSVKVYGLTESSRARGVRTEITDAVTESVIFDVGESTVAFEFKEEKFHEIAKYSGIEMEFDTVVGKEILEREGATVENDADLGFTDKSGILHLFKTPKPAKIHIGTILVKKVGGDNNPLDGAIFHLASSEDNAKKGNYLKMGAENVLVDFNEPGYDGATPWNGEPVPGQVGQVAFEGVNDLDENDVPKTYWLVEEKAPAGYNKLSGPIAVTFEADKATEANDYTMETTVKNTQGFVLPSTGGMGTILFTIGGIILVGVAATIFVAGRKKKSNE
ncbi:MAG: SpaH/EbpB family LPXTG-anchored major pilin, partial [Anaerovoracaceae bacterium]